MSKTYWWKIALAASLAAAAWSATFGTVVSIGGHASDLALDEARGVLYIANFTANRVEVMSLATNVIQTSFNVAAQPSSLALSPDGRYLVVTHYGPATPPASSSSAVTVIDLTSSAKRTFALGAAPLGVAFGIDGLALIVTSNDFLLLDPASGTTQELQTLASIAKTLPQPADSFPTNIVAASVAASADGTVIYGSGDTLIFRYQVQNHVLNAVSPFTASPPLGPRAVSVSQDGSYFTAGWVLFDSSFFDVSQFTNPSGTLNIGTTTIDSASNTIYAQIPASGNAQAPILQILDADNLTLRNRLQLPENFAGKSVLSSDASTLYGVSDSGVMVLRVGALGRSHQVAALQPSLVFRGNFCDRRIATQTLTITDPGGGNTAFRISSDTNGLNVSPSTGVTPATVTVTVDPNVFANQKGTVSASLTIQSSQAVNIPSSVRVLINSRQPEQRGTLVDVPGKLVDLLADPTRNRFYILRQDTNEVLVFNAANNSPITKLRTYNQPTGMAITFDQRYLLVGCDASQLVSVYDLETLQATQPIRMAPGNYVQSLASSSNAILAVVRNSAGDPGIHRIDLAQRTSSRLPSLGVYQNKVPINSVMAASSNGASILIASFDGNVLLYDANVDSFTISRKDFTALSGSYAASNFNLYVVGTHLLDSSLVPISELESGTGSASGFAFVDQFAFRTTAPTSATGAQSTAPGVIQRLDVSNPSNLTNAASLATLMTEAPLLGGTGAAFTRTLAPLYSRSAIINLTVSGFTVLPWNYDAAVAPPHINGIVNAADLNPAIAPGGLISVFGTNLSPVNLATAEMPLPTALADSCLTVNGLPMPIFFVSPNQVNAQMPFETVGNVSLILRTPGGSSDSFNTQVIPGAPSIFHSGVAGPLTDVPTIIRDTNGELVTDSDPIHKNDTIVIFLTGLGVTFPAVPTGMPAPVDPLAVALVKPAVTIGGVSLPLSYYGLAPGLVGVYQINAQVPRNVPTGLSVPLAISQSGYSNSLSVRVVE